MSLENGAHTIDQQILRDSSDKFQVEHNSFPTGGPLEDVLTPMSRPAQRLTGARAIFAGAVVAISSIAAPLTIHFNPDGQHRMDFPTGNVLCPGEEISI